MGRDQCSNRIVDVAADYASFVPIDAIGLKIPPSSILKLSSAASVEHTEWTSDRALSNKPTFTPLDWVFCQRSDLIRDTLRYTSTIIGRLSEVQIAYTHCVDAYVPDSQSLSCTVSWVGLWLASVTPFPPTAAWQSRRPPFYGRSFTVGLAKYAGTAFRSVTAFHHRRT